MVSILGNSVVNDDVPSGGGADEDFSAPIDDDDDGDVQLRGITWSRDGVNSSGKLGGCNDDDGGIDKWLE